VLVGDIDRLQLDDLVTKTERHIQRRVRTLVVSLDEFSAMQQARCVQPNLLLWRSLHGEDRGQG